MALHIITVCHMEPEIVAWSIMRYLRTTRVRPSTWTLLDNKWPLDAANVGHKLKLLEKVAYNGWLETADVNLGGHGGFNHILKRFAGSKLTGDDYILGYDPDSNPVTEGWLEAMLDVMDADKTLGYVSLLPNRLTDSPWTYETIAGNKVAFLDRPEWWNVTLFRAPVLAQGMLSDAGEWGATYYGHVETAMFRHVRELGMRNGYMFDYREDKCCIEHPKSYTRWKQEHAYGKFKGNFDEYCKQKGLK